MRTLLAFLLLTSTCYAEEVRVFEKPDGSLAVTHFAPGAEKFTPEHLAGLPFQDMEFEPVMAHPKARMKSGKVEIDDSVVDPNEKKRDDRTKAINKLKGMGLTKAEAEALFQ